REVEGDGKGIKDPYMKLLGKNRLLRIKLEKLPGKDTGKRASMTYRDALYVNQGQQSLGTMKIRRVLTPPKQSQIKTVVIKPNSLPGGEAHKNEALGQLKDHVDQKLSNLKIDRIVKRWDDIIVRAPLDREDMTTFLEKLVKH
ncbi:hypothetical protein FOZ63_016330, partial [Perkinsus olseni]